MKTKLHQQLNSEKQTNEEIYWELLDLEHSYQFYIGNISDPDREVFFEHDELVAFGAAFGGNLPMSMLDVFEKLEVDCPEFGGINCPGGVKIVRKRLNNPGILLMINDTVKDFISDRALRTVNFIDFYENIKQQCEGE